MTTDTTTMKVKLTENDILGVNVRRHRARVKMGATEAARQLCVSRRYWYDIEAGTANPCLDKMQRIAQMFSTSVVALLTAKGGAQ